MASERLKREKQFHFKNYLLGTPRPHANMHLKSAPQKLNFVIGKAIYKSYKLDCRCKCSLIVTHSNAASFLIKNYFM